MLFSLVENVLELERDLEGITEVIASSQVATVPQLNSSNEEIQETEFSSKKRRGGGYVYEFYQMYDSIEEAVRVVEAEANWRRKNKRKTVNGFKWEYQCNKVKSRSREQCKSALYILLHISDTLHLTL